jgi:hypothetical protein
VGSLVVVLVTPTSALSQAAATVAPGDTVRVQAPARIVMPDVITMEAGRVETRVPHEKKDDLVVLRYGGRTLHLPRPGHRVTGRLVGVTDEAITLRDGGEQTITVPRQAVERLEVWHGGEHRGSGAVGATTAFALGCDRTFRGKGLLGLRLVHA